jgi:thiamine-phosphate pyrophosphorylase
MPPSRLVVQLRDKQRARPSLRVFAGELRVVTRAAGAALVVNGDAEVARDVGADGVHLGGGAGTVESARRVLGRAAWISAAAHTDEEVERAVAQGADAVLVSPIFDSKGKKGRGLGALRRAREIVARLTGKREKGSVAVVALGGVDADNAAACASAGAEAVAVVRALLASHDPGRTARTLHDALARRC